MITSSLPDRETDSSIIETSEVRTSTYGGWQATSKKCAVFDGTQKTANSPLVETTTSFVSGTSFQKLLYTDFPITWPPSRQSLGAHINITCWHPVVEQQIDPSNFGIPRPGHSSRRSTQEVKFVIWLGARTVTRLSAHTATARIKLWSGNIQRWNRWLVSLDIHSVSFI